jgi:glycosyltransferase involved in cell wall biosynthesis
MRSARADRAVARGRRPVVALVIDAVFPYHLGGREVRYHELTRRLAAGASIHVYTMRWWKGERTFADGNVTFHAISGLHDLYSGGRRSVKQALFFAAACVKLFGQDFDVIDADQMPYFQIIVLRLIATLRRKPLVVTWHEVWGKYYWREYLGRPGSLAWIIEWLAMRLPDHIVAASPQTAERLLSILGPRASVTVAPNGVDLDLIADTYPDATRTDVIVVGRLIAHKRVGMLLDALALLHAQGLPATCRVIGDGPDRAALHEKAVALGLSGAVEFRHDVREPREIYALVKAARVAVFPSDREGFGAAVLEALACGVPVITTSSPDNLAQHLAARSVRGYICDPSAEAIAAELSRLLADGSARSDERDPWLTEYSWDVIASRVAAALQIGPLATQPSGPDREALQKA